MTHGWLEAEARAKVNLRLRIFPRASDGFHPLETLFCRITLADRVRLRFRDRPGVSIRVLGLQNVPRGRENLAARAAAALIERLRIDRGVEIELRKRVPPGSGLGGGSSDAAAVLRLMNVELGTPIDRGGLLALASKLGSDVAFFVADLPLALGRGRGDRITSCPALASRPMLLLLSDPAVSTADAYRLWDEMCGPRSEGQPPEASLSSPAVPKDWEAVQAAAANDFEPVIFPRYPHLEALKRKLEETAPLFALLSGSGCALFAVYASERTRDEAASMLKRDLSDVKVVSVSGPE